VKPDGTLYEGTTLAQPGKAGSISVFAPAIDVNVPGPGVVYNPGTSQAAALVVSESSLISTQSGLAAYYYGLPLSNDQDIVKPSDDMKRFMTHHAWTRVSEDKLGE
jgi:hypothetical protein